MKSCKVIEISHLSYHYPDGTAALEDVDLEVWEHESVAVLGPNGAGKSTTFNMVNGQLRPDSGSVKLDGVDLVGLKPRQIWQMGVSRTFQIAETFASLTVVENVQLARDTFRLRFRCPEIARRIVPGQFVMLRVAGEEAYPVRVVPLLRMQLLRV